MKKLTRLLAVVLAMGISHSLSAQVGKLEITHLTGDFYVYTTYHVLGGKPYPSNSLYVVTSKGVVLIDTPWDSTEFQPLLDSIEARHHKKAVLCISTHYHSDRTAGLDYFKQKGIKTYSSAYTRQLCAANNEKQAEYTFSKDTSFTVGNHTFQTYYPGEGHTKDNIVIWFNKEKILYGGCFIKSSEVPDLGNVADANVAQWPISIQKVMERFKKPAYIIPGHMSWAGTGSLAHTLQLLEQHEKMGN
jgi:glyoxylase-like metal-dependent hydrolase (beta-lactamase superfamily II)